VYLFRSVDVGALGRQLRDIHWGWAAIATALAPTGIWARAVRWRHLFPARARPGGLVAATMIGYMANNVLPLRAGEFVRVYVVARRWDAAAAGSRERSRGFWIALATLVVERVLDSLFIVAMLAILVLVIPVPVALQWAAVILLAVDVVGIALLVGLAVAPDWCRQLTARLLGRWPALRDRTYRGLETFVQGLEGIRTWERVVPILVWTAVVWILPALAAWTMLLAMGLHLPWLAGWTVLVFVGLGVSIPSAPGYVGVFHAAAALAVTLFGVEQPVALGYALVFHASQIVPVTLLGWLYLVREHVSLGEATHARVPPAEAS